MGLLKRKAKIKNTVKPNPNLFNHSKVGRTPFKPLKHKDGSPFTDIEYFELLGKKVEELEKNNPNPNLPVDFQSHGLDPQVVAFTKTVCEAIKEGRPESEITAYITQSIDYDK